MSSYNVDKIFQDLYTVIILIYIFGFISGLLFISGFTKFGLSLYVIIFLFWLLFLVVGIFICNKRIDDFIARFKGIKGEWRVSTILQQMWDSDVRHVDDVVLSNRGNIDHIAIAKNGIWVIETKYIDGEIKKIDGILVNKGKPFKKDPIKQTMAEFYAVKRFLDRKGIKNVPIFSVLVFAGPYAKVRLGLKPINNVYIVSALGLRRLIVDSELKQKLSVSQISKLQKLFEKESDLK